MDSLPHTHDEYNIVFCRTPGLSYSLRSRVETVTPGDVLVINPGEAHSGHCGSRGVEPRGLTLHIPVPEGDPGADALSRRSRSQSVSRQNWGRSTQFDPREIQIGSG